MQQDRDRSTDEMHASVRWLNRTSYEPLADAWKEVRNCINGGEAYLQMTYLNGSPVINVAKIHIDANLSADRQLQIKVAFNMLALAVATAPEEVYG